MLTDLPFLCPETPLKEQGQMQPPLPLVGEAIEQTGMRAGTWHVKLIAPATAAPGTSAPVCCPGLPQLEAVVLEATPVNSGPDASRRQEVASHVLPATLHLFGVAKY